MNEFQEQTPLDDHSTEPSALGACRFRRQFCDQRHVTLLEASSPVFDQYHFRPTHTVKPVMSTLHHLVQSDIIRSPWCASCRLLWDAFFPLRQPGEPLAQVMKACAIEGRGLRTPPPVLCFTEYYELRYVVRGAGVRRGRHEPDCISAVVPRKTITPCDRSQLFRLSKRTRAIIGRPGSSNGFAKEEEAKGIP